MRGLRRRLPATRRRRRDALADGALLPRLGHDARRSAHRRHRRAELGLRSQPRPRWFLDRPHCVRLRPARRQPGRCRLRAGLPALPPRRHALARWRDNGRAIAPLSTLSIAALGTGTTAAGHRRGVRARPHPRARDGGRLRRGPLRSRWPHQPRRYAGRVRARQGGAAHLRQLRRHEGRAEGHPARYGAAHLPRQLLAGRRLPRAAARPRALPLRCCRQPGRGRRRPHAAAGRRLRGRWRDRPPDAGGGGKPTPSTRRWPPMPRYAADAIARCRRSGASARAGSPASTPPWRSPTRSTAPCRPLSPPNRKAQLPCPPTPSRPPRPPQPPTPSGGATR